MPGAGAGNRRQNHGVIVRRSPKAMQSRNGCLAAPSPAYAGRLVTDKIVAVILLVSTNTRGRMSDRRRLSGHLRP